MQSRKDEEEVQGLIKISSKLQRLSSTDTLWLQSTKQVKRVEEECWARLMVQRSHIKLLLCLIKSERAQTCTTYCVAHHHFCERVIFNSRNNLMHQTITWKLQREESSFTRQLVMKTQLELYAINRRLWGNSTLTKMTLSSYQGRVTQKMKKFKKRRRR